MHTWEAFLEEAVPELQMRLHLTFEGGRAFLAEGTSAGQEATGARVGLVGGAARRVLWREPWRRVPMEPTLPLPPQVSVSRRRVTGMLTFTTDAGNELVNTPLSGACPGRMKSLSPPHPLISPGRRGLTFST